MPRGRFRLIVRWIIFATAGVVGIATILMLAGPSIRSWQMERATARFEKRPTQSRADSLVELLQAHAGTDRQGKRALALLLRPNIVTRKAYAPGRPIAISIARPFKLDFRRFLWMEETISVNGQPVMQGHGADHLDPVESCLRVPLLPTQPGTYPVELRLQYSLGIECGSRMTTVLDYLHDGLPWLIPESGTWRPGRTYECDVTVSSEVIVGGDDAEEIGLISSPELDQAMRAAFSTRYIGMETGISTPAGMRWVRGSAQISYENIPLAVAFRVALRLPDGRETPVHSLWPSTLSARAGSSGSLTIDPSSLVVETPGRYNATLVLAPDPGLAYTDVAIKSIWNGTLELPIRFTVDANAPSR
jgi:hypothetical protein